MLVFLILTLILSISYSKKEGYPKYLYKKLTSNSFINAHWHFFVFSGLKTHTNLPRNLLRKPQRNIIFLFLILTTRCILTRLILWKLYIVTFKEDQWDGDLHQSSVLPHPSPRPKNCHYNLGSGDGKVVRALASHQWGPGSIPGPGVIRGLSLLLVLVLAPRVFSPGPPVFPPSSKTNISKFHSM